MSSRKVSSTARAGAEGSPRLRWAMPDSRGQEAFDADEAEPGAKMGRDRGGGEHGRAVALEGERRQQADAVELDPGPEPDAGRLHRRVDLAAKRRARGRQEQLEALEVGDVDLLDSRQRVVLDRDDEDDVLLEQRLGHEVAARARGR